MLILHTSDTHIGAFRSATQAMLGPLRRALLLALEEVAEAASREGAEVVVVAGDLFDRPSPDLEDLRTAASALSAMAARGVRVVAVPGNHEAGRGATALDVLEAAGLVRVPRARVEGGRLALSPVRVGDVDFYGLPGMRRSKEAEYIEAGAVAVEGGSAPVRVLVAHTVFYDDGWDRGALSARLGEGFEVPGRAVRRWAYSAGFRYVALGHLHLPYPLAPGRARAAYPGAPVGRDRDDLVDTCRLARAGHRRRALLVDTSEDPPRVEAVELRSAPEVACLVAQYGPDLEERVYAALSGLAGRGVPAAVALTVRGVPRDRAADAYSKVYRAWERAGASVAVHYGVEWAVPAPAARAAQAAPHEGGDPIAQAVEEAAAEVSRRLGIRVSGAAAYRALELLTQSPRRGDLVEALEEVLLGGRV